MEAVFLAGAANLPDDSSERLGIAQRGRRPGLVNPDLLGQGWRARYLKEVDAQESTLRFWQEIYDDKGKLVEVHEKYPMDKGHQKV